MNRKLLLLAAAVSIPSLVGCGPQAPAEKTETAANAPGGHVHSHDEVGAHGGHMLHMDPAGVHAEWTHDDDTHSITVFLEDFDATKIQEAKFVAKIGEAVEEFPLVAGDDGWSVTSEALMTHINMGEAAEVNLVVVDESGEQKAKIEAHEHHHH